MYHSTVMYLHVWLVENSAMEVAVKGRFIQSPETNSRVCQKNKGTAVTLSDQSLLDSPFIFALYMLMNQRKNLSLDQDSYRAFFHSPLN